MNRIVIELSDRDRSLLEGLMGSVATLASVIGSSLPAPVRQETITNAAAAFASDHPAEDVAPLQQAEVAVGLPVEGAAHLEPVTVEPDPTPAPAPAVVPLGEFQKVLVTRCAESPDVKQKVQALVHKYAESVSAIPEDKRPEVLAALAQI